MATTRAPQDASRTAMAPQNAARTSLALALQRRVHARIRNKNRDSFLEVPAGCGAFCTTARRRVLSLRGLA